MTRDDLKQLILECLAEYDVAKRVKRRKPKADDLPVHTVDRKHIYALSHVWLDCIGAVDIGRIGKVFKPLLLVYHPDWIAEGIRHYAKERQRNNDIRYASPENFASRASGYILPVLPNNELTEQEAALLGPEMVAAREHANVMGLLTERARGG